MRTDLTYTLPQALPHAPGAILLDRIVGYDTESLTAEVVIRKDSPFCDGQAVPGYVGLEYMAQAQGAFVGIALRQRGRPVEVELLLGTRRMDCKVPAFPVGMTLTVRAKLLFWDPDGVCAFACEVREGGRVIATAEIKGYSPDDVEPFLQTVLATLPAPRPPA